MSLNTGQVYYQNVALQQLLDLQSPNNYCDDILYDAQNQRLWAGLGKSLHYWESNQWIQATGIHPITKKPYTYAIRSLWQDANDLGQ